MCNAARHEEPCTLHTNPGHGSDEKKRTVEGAVSSLFCYRNTIKEMGIMVKMAGYIEDWPWLDIPDFTEEYEKLNPEGIYLGVCVRYTERRDMDIRIYPDGKIIVRAPLDADNSKIAKFIREEENWIRKSFEELRNEADKNM